RPAECDRHGVHGEIASRQVLRGGPRTHLRERAWPRVGLRAALGDVDAPVDPFHDGRSETLVELHFGHARIVAGQQRGELGGQLGRAAIDRYIELTWRVAQQEIAYRPADERQVLAVARQLEQLPGAA